VRTHAANGISLELVDRRRDWSSSRRWPSGEGARAQSRIRRESPDIDL